MLINMKTFIPAAISVGIAALFLLSCKSATTTPPTPDNTGTTLTAFKLASDADAPNFNSANIESCWSSATPLTVTASPIGSFTGSTFPVTISSVVSSKNVYFLVQYADADPNYLQQPLHFHGGDATKGVNWSIDSNTYDDGVSLIFEQTGFPGTSGSKTFIANGCAMLCHTNSTSNWNPGMFSENNGRYSIWYWHAGKGNGSGYADNDQSIGAPNYDIESVDNNAEIYDFNVISDNPGVRPYYVAGGTNRNLDKNYFIAEETAQQFQHGVAINPATNKAWAMDDIVPSFSLALPSVASDYYAVNAKGYWANGKWTVKFQRALNTGAGNPDAQFASGNQYLFSFAIHNNNAPADHYGAANNSFVLKIP